MTRTDVRLRKVALPRRIRRELGRRPARMLRDVLPEMVAAYRGRA
jgi:nucleoside-diphosphate-sugar epimerase